MTTLRKGFGHSAALIAGWLVISQSVQAQFAKNSIPIDLGSGAIVGTLPFDVEFTLTAAAPSALQAVRLWVGQTKDDVATREWVSACKSFEPPPKFGGIGSKATNVQPGSDTTFERRVNEAKAIVALTQILVNEDSLKLAALTSRTDLVRLERVQLLDLLEVVSTDSERQRLLAEIAMKDQLIRAKTDTQSVAQRKLIGDRASVVIAQQALSAVRRRIAPTAVWDRRELDSVTTLNLGVGAIEPNQDYAFCFQVVRTPTDAQKAEYQKKAIDNVAVAVRGFMLQPIETLQDLEDIQNSLIAALPASDSLEYARDGRVFQRRESLVVARPSYDTRAYQLAMVYANLRDPVRATKAGITEADSEAVDVRRYISEIFKLNSVLELLARTPVEVANGPVPDSSKVRAISLAKRLAYWPAGNRSSVAEFIADGSMVASDIGLPDRARKLTRETPISRVDSLKRNIDQSIKLFDEFRSLAESEHLQHVKRGDNSQLSRDLAAVIEHLTNALLKLSEQSGTLSRISSSLGDSEKVLQRLVADVKTVDVDRINLKATSLTTFKNRASWHISLDAGVLQVWGLHSVVPYFGANIYVRPVNKDMALAKCWSACFTRRAAFTVAVSVTSVKETGRVEDFVSSRGVFLGGGFRFTDYLRVSAGTMLVKSFEKNGPKKPATIHGRPALGAALDIDIISLFGKVAGAIVPNP